MAAKNFRSTANRFRERSERCRELADWLSDNRCRPEIGELLHRLTAETPPSATPERGACGPWETLAQTLVAVRLAWDSAGPTLHAALGHPGLFPPAESLLGRVIRLAVGAPTESFRGGEHDPTARAIESILAAVPRRTDGEPDFDTFLGWHAPRERARHGVYFTPRPLAAFVVREVDRYLREEFHLPDGLADTTSWSEHEDGTTVDGDPSYADQPLVHVLDPAAGAGMFLVEVVDRIRANWLARADAEALPHQDRSAAWNEYVARYLLPSLSARELLLPACAVAWVQVCEILARTGYRFESPQSLQITVTDSLSGPPTFNRPATVIVGNPPFSALTTSGNAWIHALLRSQVLNGRTMVGFYEVDGAPLKEKKLWLHDDYVKFLRYSQWLIESAGLGVVGLVTNHGYLDNLTFRGVRQSLLSSFPRVTVLDLHGNRKKREVAPGGQPDENVFGIDQGIAVGLFRRPPGNGRADVERGDLWGARAGKIAALGGNTGVPLRKVTPGSPNYLFERPAQFGSTGGEYLRGFPVNEVMPVCSTAAVTARDAFVIAFTREELLERMQALADPSRSDDDLRREFFFRTRSRRYPRGDTRGWKLADARQQMQAVPDPAFLLQRCLYRPFDWRWVLWADWMIDWPRNNVMRSMLAGDNLALVTRRQMIPHQPATYFYVSDSIVIDGLIRSDNRGSESFFPLYVAGADPLSGTGRQANFSPEFFAACQPLVREQPVRPEDLLAMIYAQFHSAQYRERYQVEFCTGFPRIFVPRNRSLFERLAALGRQLLDAHLLRDSDTNWSDLPGPQPPLKGVRLPHRGWPRHTGQQLAVCGDWCLEPVPDASWQFLIGGYQVCLKWLRDRAGRQLSMSETEQFRRILSAVATTRHVMTEIDAAIGQAGGWPGAFRGR